MTDSSSVQDAVRWAERYAAVLTEAAWVLTNETWREDLADGIAVEAVLERQRGRLFMHFIPDDEHVSLTIVDEEAGEFVEFGFDSQSAEDLEVVPKLIIAAQDAVVPRRLADLLRDLAASGRKMAWEVQGQQQEDITPANLEAATYRRPLPRGGKVS